MKKKLALFAISVLAFAFNAGAVKIIHGPYLQDVRGTEATIVWISDSSTVGWVEIAPDDESHFYATERPKFFDAKYGIKNESRLHVVKLTGLEPGKSYRYRVYATEVLEHRGNYVSYGRTAATVVYQKEPLRFTTLDPDADRVRFSMVNDIHGDPDKLKTLIGHTDLESTDMVLFVGDMVSVFESEEKVFAGFMDEAVDLFASETPMFYTRGNHETRGRAAYTFQDYFSPRSEHLYYMYRQGPVCFIALDSGEDKPDNDLEYYGLTMYDNYRDEQVEWLKEVLKSEEYLTAPFRVITCHMPPMGGWHGENEIAEKFIPVLEAAGADIMLCGHTHKYHNNKAGSLAGFPVIINSNDTVLKADLDSKSMKVEVVGMDGKVVDRFELKSKR